MTTTCGYFPSGRSVAFSHRQRNVQCWPRSLTLDEPALQVRLLLAGNLPWREPLACLPSRALPGALRPKLGEETRKAVGVVAQPVKQLSGIARTPQSAQLAGSGAPWETLRTRMIVGHSLVAPLLIVETAAVALRLAETIWLGSPHGILGRVSRLASALRDAALPVLRYTPKFRGKTRVMRAIEALLPPASSEAWTTLRDGSRMRLDLRVPLESWVFWTGHHDDVALRELVAHMPREAVALEVGANIGLFAVPLGRWAAAVGGQVYAFEPMRGSYLRLLENVGANRLEQTVMSLPVALGAENGHAQLEPIEDAPSGNAIRVSHASERSVTVELRRLDDLASDLPITRCDVVKVDIEGGEFDFLVGAEGFLQRHRPVVYAELNTVHMRRLGWSDDDLISLAVEWGYRPLIQTSEGFRPYRERTGLMDNVMLIPR
jgi:FkbM family methyltransferase